MSSTTNVENKFNWDFYKNDFKGGIKLQSNQSIPNQTQTCKCYSHEPYAKELWEIYNSSKPIKKDLQKGDSILITNIVGLNDKKVKLELFGGLVVDCDLNKEKKFIELFGYNDPTLFIELLKDKSHLESFLSQGFYVYVLESTPSIKISIWHGYIKKLKDELNEQIKKPSKAYIAKVISANRGGYFVDLQGVEAFMPGSLAAPNKIYDFQTLIGKDVTVMVEDFLHDMNCFIVSHKKYLEYIIPQKIKQLDTNKLYNGIITGTSKYGIFIEFEEFFTGLLHTSKMSEETYNKFINREFKPGMNIDFYIDEITKDNRIILSEESPENKLKRIEAFIQSNIGKTLEGNVIAILKLGVLVSVNDIVGLVQYRDFKINNISYRNLLIGDKIKIKINKDTITEDNKLIFSLEKGL